MSALTLVIAIGLQLACGLVVPATATVDRCLLAAKACSLAFVPPKAQPYEPYAAGLTCVAQVEDPESLAGATILTRDSDGLVIVACRGSASVRNFRTNLDIGPVALEASPGAKVHNGFQNAGRELWKLVRPQLPKSSAPVLVTGHSLGGGTATMLSLALHAAGREAELITVAGPRLGDGAFAKFYRETCSLPATHLIHDTDDVLSSNTQLWDRLNFEHVGTVVRCGKDVPCLYETADAATPELCASDADAPPKTPSLKGVFVDHCSYLGLYIGVRLEHPWGYLRF
jgi:hypothetical protein